MERHFGATMDKNIVPTGMPTSNEKIAAASAATQLVELCSGLLPVWARHLATSRRQSETAVSEMMQAFSAIGPHVQLAERQSQQIADALNPDNSAGLAQACEEAMAPLLQHGQLPPAAAAAIEAMLALVRNATASLAQHTQPLSRETHVLAEQIERMYIGFQYQDRISQMMALLESDIARLQEAMDGRCVDSPDLTSWLARLESQYAMAEQHQDHSTAAASPGAGPDQETTFF
jgi:ABC-type transporter Mla subunit MlaD